MTFADHPIRTAPEQATDRNGAFREPWREKNSLEMSKSRSRSDRLKTGNIAHGAAIFDFSRQSNVRDNAVIASLSRLHSLVGFRQLAEQVQPYRLQIVEGIQCLNRKRGSDSRHSWPAGHPPPVSLGNASAKQRFRSHRTHRRRFVVQTRDQCSPDILKPPLYHAASAPALPSNGTPGSRWVNSRGKRFQPGLVVSLARSAAART